MTTRPQSLSLYRTLLRLSSRFATGGSMQGHRELAVAARDNVRAAFRAFQHTNDPALLQQLHHTAVREIHAARRILNDANATEVRASGRSPLCVCGARVCADVRGCFRGQFPLENAIVPELARRASTLLSDASQKKIKGGKWSLWDRLGSSQ